LPILNTIGDHIKKRRLELGLFQRDAARLLGVDTSTVTNWEKDRTQPRLCLIPKVIAFLGYDPKASVPTTLGERIREYRRVRGFSQKRLAQFLGIDPSTLARWECDEGKPGIELEERLASFFRKLS
jgi:transcriptional regulator with XRE-family HTH domain